MRRARSKANQNPSSESEYDSISTSDDKVEPIKKKANRIKNKKPPRHSTLCEETSDDKVEPIKKKVNRIKNKKPHRHSTLHEDMSEDDVPEVKNKVKMNCRMVTLKILWRNRTNLTSSEDTPRVEMWSYKVKKNGTENRTRT